MRCDVPASSEVLRPAERLAPPGEASRVMYGLQGSLREPRFKRPFDLVLSSLGLLISLPLWLLVAAGIWWSGNRSRLIVRTKYPTPIRALGYILDHARH